MHLHMYIYHEAIVQLPVVASIYCIQADTFTRALCIVICPTSWAVSACQTIYTHQFQEDQSLRKLLMVSFSSASFKQGLLGRGVAEV